MDEMLPSLNEAFVNDEELPKERGIKNEKLLDEVAYAGKELCKSLKTELQGQVHKDASAEELEEAV